MAKKYGKLVRDKIPNIIRRNGEDPITRTLSPAEHKKYLLDKIVEEAEEIRKAASSNEALMEIADLYQAASDFARLSGISRKKIRHAIKTRRNERGGFRKGIFLKEVKKIGK